ncbi:Ubiquitin-like modifier-activating enzyme atg7 [Thelohanellus kitauei]|uniref:Ubiquitin-like modifier-activating enzyme atg7 n=1 Tax=Thelohanellus kitauei TaxID=669202 RepID=A0A0C2MML0_THEKT|nr:Ubiquitin-like modifier-activating enzyme atg7 [Thelohanellus kitauei]
MSSQLDLKPIINPNFWISVEKRKLGLYKLEETPIEIYLYLSGETGRPCLCFDEECFDLNRTIPEGCLKATGYLFIYNTFERLLFRANNDKSANPFTTKKEIWAPTINLVAYYLFVRKMDEVELIVNDNDQKAGVSITKLIDKAVDEMNWKKKEFSIESDLKKVDLSPLISTNVLIRESFMMSLRLMKWQIYPALNLDKIIHLKCLLIGAGTLGCNVARNLLGWGITNITLIDDGFVSYSNPCRQSLYTIKDCQSHLGKAEIAAQNLKDCYPFANSRGLMLRIPEPGHPVHANDQTLFIQSIATIQEEIINHDVVFLLTDTRESRWLPTVLCVAFNKLAICSAIGAESMVVLRHPLSASIVNHTPDLTPVNKLGCFFCSDIAIPQNSHTNQTIDRKCSVTRIGTSQMAAAHAVELLISLSQHPLGFEAPAMLENNENHDREAFGITPHQIRYYFSTYTQLLGVLPRFDKCIACSSYVVEEFKKTGSDFIKSVCDDPKMLTSLTKLKKQIDAIEMDVDKLFLDC